MKKAELTNLLKDVSREREDILKLIAKTANIKCFASFHSSQWPECPKQFKDRSNWWCPSCLSREFIKNDTLSERLKQC